jgi:hypothetical protein
MATEGHGALTATAEKFSVGARRTFVLPPRSSRTTTVRPRSVYTPSTPSVQTGLTWQIVLETAPGWPTFGGHAALAAVARDRAYHALNRDKINRRAIHAALPVAGPGSLHVDGRACSFIPVRRTPLTHPPIELGVRGYMAVMISGAGRGLGSPGRRRYTRSGVSGFPRRRCRS